MSAPGTTWRPDNCPAEKDGERCAFPLDHTGPHGRPYVAFRYWGDEDPKTRVSFNGGPWDQETAEVGRVVGPVFAVGHQVGNHYWLNSKSDPPTYHWDGAPWERDPAPSPLVAPVEGS